MTNTHKWYVFDEADCFFQSYDGTEAMTMAESLIKDELKGVHLAYMSLSEFNAYCTTGEFPFSTTKIES